MALLTRLRRAVSNVSIGGDARAAQPKLTCKDYWDFELGIPLPPRELIASEKDHWHRVRGRSQEHATPQDSLYRMYECLILDPGAFHHEVGLFWQNGWSVKNIPDPHDRNEERLVMIVCIVKLLVTIFSQLNKHGFPRGNGKALEVSAKQPSVPLEKLPEWAWNVGPLQSTLKIPHWDKRRKKQVTLSSLEDDDAWELFKEHNILIKRDEDICSRFSV